jgi:PKD repeat protein
MRIVPRGALAVLAIVTLGCSLGDPAAPPLSGPSSLGLSVTLHATPDRMFQDGTSKSTISAVVHDATGKPVSGLPLEWGVTASDRTVIEPSWRFSTTDANGMANVEVKAPAPPTELPPTPLVLTVTATPLSADASNSIPRQVTVQVVSPGGTLPPNEQPVPSFTISPTTAMITQTVTFDASATRDEDVRCNDLCTYDWDFGDGTTGRGRIATHVFAGAGTYIVTLRVTDARNGSAMSSGTITITAPEAPTVVLSVAPNPPVVNQLATFTARATPAEGHSIREYQWNFGDGTSTTTTASTVTKTYLARGVYTATVRAIDDLGKAGAASLTLDLTAGTATGIAAAFTLSPANPLVGDVTIFNASSSTPSNGATIVEYRWDWGDGTTTETGLPITQHVFELPRAYVIRLTVVDSQGRIAITTSAIAATTLPVGAVTLTGLFTVSPTGIRPPNSAVFFDAAGSSTTGSSPIVSYEWFWGDGTSEAPSASAQASHTFTAAGTYVVRLIVRDSSGRAGTTTASVAIGP